MRLVSNGLDRVLGCANELNDLSIFKQRVMLGEPSDCIRLFLAARHGRVARALGTCLWAWVGAGPNFQACFRIFLTPLDFGQVQGVVLGRVDTDDVGVKVAIGDALNFQWMNAAEFGDLIKTQRGVVNQPYRCSLRHQWTIHELSPLSLATVLGSRLASSESPASPHMFGYV